MAQTPWTWRCSTAGGKARALVRGRREAMATRKLENCMMAVGFRELERGGSKRYMCKTNLRI